MNQSIDGSFGRPIDGSASIEWTHYNMTQYTGQGQVRMAASMDVDEPAAAGKMKQTLTFRVADAVVSGLFAIDPLFNTISKKARASIQGRAESLGFSWDGMVDDLKRHSEALEAEFE
jgi:hypothetical protein